MKRWVCCWVLLLACSGWLAAGPAEARPRADGGHVQIYAAGQDGVLVEIVLEGTVLAPDTEVVEAHFDGLKLCFEGDPTVESIGDALITKLRYFAIPTKSGTVKVRGFELEDSDGRKVWVGGRPEGTLDSDAAAGETGRDATFYVDPEALRERREMGRLRCSDFDLEDVDWEAVAEAQREFWRQEREARPAEEPDCEGPPRLEAVRVVGESLEDVAKAATRDKLFLEAIITGDGGGVREALRLLHASDFGVLAGPERAGVSEEDGRCRWIWRWRVGVPLPGQYRAPDVQLTTEKGARTQTLRGPVLRVTGKPLVGVPLARGMVSQYGGRTVGGQANRVFERAIRVEAGWPGLRVAYVQPVSERLDVTPRMGLLWGRHLYTGLFGLEPGLEVRRTIYDDGELSLGVLGEASLLSVQDGGTGGGIFGGTLGAGLTLGYRVAHDLALSTGLRIRPTVLGGASDAAFRLPLVVDMALEYMVGQTANRSTNLGVLVGLGPDLCAAGGCLDHELHLEAGVGLSVSWKSGR